MPRYRVAWGSIPPPLLRWPHGSRPASAKVSPIGGDVAARVLSQAWIRLRPKIRHGADCSHRILSTALPSSIDRTWRLGKEAGRTPTGLRSL